MRCYIENLAFPALNLIARVSLVRVNSCCLQVRNKLAASLSLTPTKVVTQPFANVLYEMEEVRII